DKFLVRLAGAEHDAARCARFRRPQPGDRSGLLLARRTERVRGRGGAALSALREREWGRAAVRRQALCRRARRRRLTASELSPASQPSEVNPVAGGGRSAPAGAATP